MSDLIKNPLTNKYWDPSKGDYVSKSIIKENLKYEKKQRRKKLFIGTLTVLHLFLLLLVFLLY